MNLEKLKSNLFNIPGWHTNRKIIVFESDDWGSIRIPSRRTYDYLLKMGYPIGKSPYGKDSLESNEDLTELLSTLSSSKNSDGKHPRFTFNTIIANPNFEKIKGDNFANYHYELFTETYKKYPKHKESFELINEGIRNELIKPQLHGREHLNVRRWINSLKLKFQEPLDLFTYSMYGLPYSISRAHGRDVQRAFEFEMESDIKESCQILTEACNIFFNVWGYHSESFIAPNFFWDENIEKCLVHNGVRYLQGQRAQFITNYKGSYTARYHFTGQRNIKDQIYLVRNCFFEPALDQKKDWIGSCLKGIESAFFWKKPAIISTHRVNYIGSIDESNRTCNLGLLKRLIRIIVSRWPDVEFLSSDELGKSIKSDIDGSNAE